MAQAKAEFLAASLGREVERGPPLLPCGGLGRLLLPEPAPVGWGVRGPSPVTRHGELHSASG